LHGAVANGCSQDFVCEVDLISRAKIIILRIL